MPNPNTPLPDPNRSKDANWAEKIEIAKKAREAGQVMRSGKPPVAPNPKLNTRDESPR